MWHVDAAKAVYENVLPRFEGVFLSMYSNLAASTCFATGELQSARVNSRQISFVMRVVWCVIGPLSRLAWWFIEVWSCEWHFVTRRKKCFCGRARIIHLILRTRQDRTLSTLPRACVRVATIDASGWENIYQSQIHNSWIRKHAIIKILYLLLLHLQIPIPIHLLLRRNVSSSSGQIHAMWPLRFAESRVPV